VTFRAFEILSIGVIHRPHMTS